MNSPTDASIKREPYSGKIYGTNEEDPFGSNALGTKCFKISGVHPNRMSCPARDTANAKFSITGAVCTDGNNPDSVCTHTCTQDARPFDLTATTSICHCEAKCLWFNTFAGDGKDWKKGGQIRCKHTNCERPGVSWNDRLWGTYWTTPPVGEAFQCFRDDLGTGVYDESIILETAMGPNDMSESAIWPIGSYCRQIDCGENQEVERQAHCACAYTDGGVDQSNGWGRNPTILLEHYRNQRCNWSADRDNVASYCEDIPDPDVVEVDSGCWPMREDVIDEAGVENWDKEAGIVCSHEKQANGNYPLLSVCYFNCLEGYVHEEANMSSYGVPGQCHFATYNDKYYNEWLGLDTNDYGESDHWFPNCIKIEIQN